MAPSKTALAKINIAKKELALSDEAYRHILQMHFQVDSAARLNNRQATVLINNFKAHGWKERRAQKKPTKPGYSEE
ncbi:MAG: DUF1018 domain-containing protein [Desulfocapsaceae bacterium]|nr:DUF1018 domain-containing protein [Desulfocapsaceae bacterium]